MALENKLGINDSSTLAREEERISKIKAIELFELGILNTLDAGKFSSLAIIHKYLFGDIYDFAGKIRTVNIARGNFRFAPVMYLEQSLEHIDNMPDNTYEEIIEKYVEIKELLKPALTSNTNDRLIFMKGIDASYNYEGYFAYSIEQLKK